MHAASQDLEILERACGVGPRRLVDTQVAAGFVGLGSPGLGVLLQRRLGINLPKADRLTDWLHRPLNDEALSYAAADVAYLDDLWASLRTELERRGGWRGPRRVRQDPTATASPADPRWPGGASRRPAGSRAGPAAWPRRWPPGASGAPAGSTGRCATCCPTWRWSPSPSARPAPAGTSGGCAGSTAATSRDGAGDELMAAVKAGADLTRTSCGCRRATASTRRSARR